MSSPAAIRLRAFALTLALGILAVGASIGGAAAEGYWRYRDTAFSPSEAELQLLGKTPGRVDEKHVSGGFQPEFSGQGAMELFFKNDDIERRNYLSQLTFTYGASAPMLVLVPGDSIDVEVTVSFASNYPGAEAQGGVAVDSGDYIAAVSVRDGQQSARGSFKVPGGGPGATLRYIASAYIAAYGGFSETMTNSYEWVEGLPPVADQPTPAAAGGFGGRWTTSEGEMDLVQSGSSVNGTYSQDNGRLSGEVVGGRLAGYWAEDGSNTRCATERMGSFYWGRIEWTLSAAGDGFEGGWSYCDQPVSGSWRGTRLAP